MAGDRQAHNAFLRFLSRTGPTEPALVGMTKAPGAKQVPACGTMSAPQRARVKVLSWGQIVDEQERRRDGEACGTQSREPAQEAGNWKGGSDVEPAGRSRGDPILCISESISWS